MVSRRRPKVGLTRMHAAVDAMRPMGFSPAVVRRRVKQLLKVYGDDGWVFIEDGAYKQLIDTLLEEPEPELVLGNEDGPEVPLLDCVPEQSPLQTEESNKHVEVPVLLDDTISSGDHGCSDVLNEQDTFGEDNSITIEKNPKDRSDVVVSPVHLKDTIPRNRNSKPCYGWISDEDEDDLPELNQRKPYYGYVGDDVEDDDLMEFNPKIESNAAY